jgi:hypothetical protein
MTLVMLVLIAVAAVVDVFIASAGRPHDWPTHTSYYDMLAEGFRSGQLSLVERPSAALLAQADPYLPQYASLWLWDASLFEGKYYIYWGPFPAAVQAAGKVLLGVHRLVGDQYLVLGFSLLSTALAGLMLKRIVERLFSRLPTYLFALGCATLALANPVPYILARPGVYEAAITGGQACLLAGLVPAFDAVWGSGERRVGVHRLLVAGTAWGFAVACRATLLPAVLALVLATAVAAVGLRRARAGRLAAAMAILTAPVVTSTALLLVYNKLRFHSWFEFGVKYQLTWLKFELSRTFIPANLYSYLFRSPDWRCQFPFAITHWEQGPLPRFIKSAPGYVVNEPLVGVLLGVPVVWLGAAAVLRAIPLARWSLSFRNGGLSRWSRAYLWCAVSFCVLGVATSATELTLFMATMRYLGNCTTGLVLLGLLGGYTLWSRRTHRPARVFTALVCTGAMSASIVLGLLLGYQGYFNILAQRRPELNTALVNSLSVCGGSSTAAR